MDPIAAALAAEEDHRWQEAAAAWALAEIGSPHDQRLPWQRAQALWLADAPLPALKACQRALTLEPAAAPAHQLLGHILRDLNHFEAAESAYAEAMRLEGDRPSLTAWGRSQILIGLERYEEAFAFAEGRLAVENPGCWRSGPWWQGWPAGAGDPCPRDLVIWSEQGLGEVAPLRVV